MTRLLLCEDDSSVGQMIQRGLRKTGFEVDWVQQGYQALDLAFTGRYQSLVLDLMLPDIDGLALCRHLREQQITTPVLMLTARDSVEHKVDGFEAGADDYLTKPFAFAELLARMKALIRRSGATDTDDVVDYGAMRLDRGAREVFCHGERVELTEREFQLLVCLAESSRGNGSFSAPGARTAISRTTPWMSMSDTFVRRCTPIASNPSSARSVAPASNSIYPRWPSSQGQQKKTAGESPAAISRRPTDASHNDTSHFGGRNKDRLQFMSKS